MLSYEKIFVNQLTALLREHGPAKDSFMEATTRVRKAYCDEIVRRRDALLDRLSSASHQLCPHGKLLSLLWRELRSYISRCDWNFIDPTILMACCQTVPEDVWSQSARVSLIYQGFRIVDDLLDRHMDYKGGSPTLYGKLWHVREADGHIVAASVLSAILLLCEGLSASPRQRVELAEKTLMGALHEDMPPENVNLAVYYRIVEGKMVSYGMLQYSPILEHMAVEEQARVEPFLRGSFVLSQLANDLVDVEDDQKRGQPNFWRVCGTREKGLELFWEKYLNGYEQSNTLPERYRPYGLVRLYDIGNYVVQALGAEGQTQ